MEIRMIWSRLKKTFESRLTRTLRGRLQVHVTAYRGRSDAGRGWIVFDGKEIVSVEAPGFTMKIGRHQFCLDLIGGYITESGFKSGARTAEMGAACGEVIQNQAANSLNSINPLVRGLAVLDKRCGKAAYKKFLCAYYVSTSRLFGRGHFTGYQLSELPRKLGSRRMAY
jgi:hypothetical protein